METWLKLFTSVVTVVSACFDLHCKLQLFDKTNYMDRQQENVNQNYVKTDKPLAFSSTP